jgi:hypothetical protein
MWYFLPSRELCFVHRTGETVDVQCALPHSLELLVTDEWCRVENIASALVVQTGIAAT